VTLAIKSQDSAMMGMKHPELCPCKEGGTAPGRKAELPGAPQEPAAPITPCLGSPMGTTTTLLFMRRRHPWRREQRRQQRSEAGARWVGQSVAGGSGRAPWEQSPSTRPRWSCRNRDAPGGALGTDHFTD